MDQQQPIMDDFQQHQTHQAFPAAFNASVHASDTSTNLDAREVVWQKLQVLKVMYLEDMKNLYGMITQRSLMPKPPEQLQKLKHYKDVLHRMIPYLTVPKERVPRDFTEDKVAAFEKQIVNSMEIFKRRMLTSLQQPGPLSQEQFHPNERLELEQQEQALPQLQLLQQQQQQMLQQQQQVLQERISQHQQEVLKHLWRQQQFQQQQQFQRQFQRQHQQQQKELQEQQRQEDMISAVTGSFSRLPLN